MEKRGYDAIIIGGGMGGLVCSSILAKKGKRILLVEKNDRVGGRYRSVEYNGFTINVYGGAPVIQNASEALKRVGASVPWIELKDPMIYYFNVDDGSFLGWPSAEEIKRDPEIVGRVVSEVLGLKGDLVKDYIRIISKLPRYTEEELRRLEDVSITDWAASETDNELLQEWLWRTVYGYGSITVMDPADVSTFKYIEWLLMAVQIIPIVAINDPRYPGTMGLPMAFARVIKENGGEIRLHSQAEKILIEGKKVVGILGKDNKYESHFIAESPVVVSNLKVWGNFDSGLLGKEDFPVQWVNDAMRLKRYESGAVSIWTATKRKMPELQKIKSWTRFLSLDDEEYTRRRKRKICTRTNTRNRGGFGAQSSFCPSMAPPDKDLVSLTLWLSTEEIDDCKQWDRWVQEGIDALRAFFKFVLKEDYDEIKEWIKVIYHRPSWGVEMYVKGFHPDIVAPGIEGLYFVGDSVAAEGRVKGIAGDLASYVGMKCADKILEAG